nr:hypothetical protein [Dickeya oryzae]
MMIPSAVDLFEDDQERMTTGSREDLPQAQTYDSSVRQAQMHQPEAIDEPGLHTHFSLLPGVR